MASEIGTTSAQRIVELRAEVRRYQARYGTLEGMDDVLRAESALAARQRRYDWLVEEAERIARQMPAAESEVERLEDWMEFCLADVIARTQKAHAEGWSPVPVMGYRLWAVTPEGLNGVRMTWPGRTMVATCRLRSGDDEVPHTDGGCGRLGCGVYAAKSVDRLLHEFDLDGIGDVAVGLVALTGKVVEHETGYRGAMATVVALAAELDTHLLVTSDPTHIERVFAHPAVIEAEPEVEEPRQRLLQMEAYVEQQARRSAPWTLASNSG